MMSKQSIILTPPVFKRFRDEFAYEINVSHDELTGAIAYNVTFEYYLPPYVIYQSDVSSSSSEVSKVSGTKYKV